MKAHKYLKTGTRQAPVAFSCSRETAVNCDAVMLTFVNVH